MEKGEREREREIARGGCPPLPHLFRVVKPERGEGKEKEKVWRLGSKREGEGEKFERFSILVKLQHFPTISS